MWVNSIQLLITLTFSSYILYGVNKWTKKAFSVRVSQEVHTIAFGVLNEVMNEHFSMKKGEHYIPRYNENQLRIDPEKDYCMKSDAFKYLHPDTVLKDIYLIREKSVEIPKQIVREHTFDMLPFLTRYRETNGPKSNKYQWPQKATQLFMHYEHLNNEFRYGEEILCLFQKYNHIPGKFAISHKNNLMDNFHRQLDNLRKKNKSEECIVISQSLFYLKANASYIPKTYRLYKENECSAFFSYIKTEEYKNKFLSQGPQFITKAGQEVHRGRGITVIFEQELEELNSNYANGTLCGQKNDILIAQRYIANPYLYKQHKIEFRIYFTITSTEPLIVHAYKKALIKRCAKPFSVFSTEKAAHVCNTAIVKQVKNKDSMDEQNDDDVDSENDYADETNEIQEIEAEEYFIDWYLEGLAELLLKEGKIKDENWLENDLYPQVYKAIIHIVRSGEYKLYRDPRLSEFFAVDFIMSDDLQLYVLEVNYNPQILSVTPERIKRNYKMILVIQQKLRYIAQDTIEINQAYTRSRFLRVKKFIKPLLVHSAVLSRKHAGTKKSTLYISSARDFIMMSMKEDKYRKEFLNLMTERLEPSIKIDKSNLYEKIIDENLQFPDAYHNLVKQECL